MNTAVDFTKLSDEELTATIASLRGKVVAMQRSAHKTTQTRNAISTIQSQLHRMEMEAKRRRHTALRAKHNHAITPSANA